MSETSCSISVRIEHKNVSKTSFQRLHDTRTGHVPAYVDQARSNRNDTLIVPGTPRAMGKVCRERRKLRITQRAMKTDASVSTVGIITFSTSAQKIIDALSRDEQNFLFEDVATAMAKRLDNKLTGLVIHRDEEAIHAHFQMPAYSLSGMPTSKLVSPKVASELQDIAGARVQKYGISRGVKKAVRVQAGEDVSTTRHRTVRQLHQDLPGELEALKIQIHDREQKLKKYDRLISKKQAEIAELGELEEKTAQAKKTLAVYEKRIFDAGVELDSLTLQLEEKPGGEFFKKLDAPDA